MHNDDRNVITHVFGMQAHSLKVSIQSSKTVGL